MPLHVFRHSDFDYTHERMAFYRMVDLLDNHFSRRETICLLANAQVVDGKKKVSPDMIIFKKDAIAVIEMKSWIGQVKFPTEDEDKYNWDNWELEHENKKIPLEASRTPIWQLDNNTACFVDFLTQSEAAFADEISQGSLWGLTSKVLLFSEDDSSFFNAAPPLYWDNTYVCKLWNKTDPRFDFCKVIESLTTKARHRKKDSRTQICLTENAILKIAGLLDAPEVSLELLKRERLRCEEDFFINPGYGYISIIANSKKKINELSPGLVPVNSAYKGAPLPVRLIAYYRSCLMVESMLSSLLVFDKHSTYYPIESSNNLFFDRGDKFLLPKNEIPSGFFQNPNSLVYGYFFIVSRSIFRSKLQWEGCPLFTTRVRLEEIGEHYICNPLVRDELTINPYALKRIEKFKYYSDEEIKNYITDKEKIVDIGERIESVLKDIQIEMPVNFNENRKFEYKYLSEGLLPVSIIFISTTGFYTHVIRDLEKIENDWTDCLKQGNWPEDIAWSFLNGIEASELTYKWAPHELSIVGANYEQSKAISLSLNKKNKLQIISGPPGTGKSQVIINIAANCHAAKQKLLFSSYNNVAVNNVVDRLNSIFADLPPIMLRTGTQDENERTIEKLDRCQAPKSQNKAEVFSALERISAINTQLSAIQQKYQQYEKLTDEFEKIQNQIRQLKDQHSLIFFRIDWYNEPISALKWIDEWQILYDSLLSSRSEIVKLTDDMNFILKEHSYLNSINWWAPFQQNLNLDAWKQAIHRFELVIQHSVNFLRRFRIIKKNKFSLRHALTKKRFVAFFHNLVNIRLSEELPVFLLQLLGKKIIPDLNCLYPIVEQLQELNSRMAKIVCHFGQNRLMNQEFELIEYRQSLEYIYSRLKTGLFPFDISFLYSEDTRDDLSILNFLKAVKACFEDYRRVQMELSSISETELLDKWERLNQEKLIYSLKILQDQADYKNLNDVISGIKNSLSGNIKMTNDAMKLFPVYSTTSLLTGKYISLSAGIYDLAVIDEASQSDVGSFLPVLYRSRRCAVIGDEMQLTPIITLPKEIDAKLAFSFSLSEDEFQRFGYSNVSMLDLACDRIIRANGRRVLLRNHYRCHPNIIEFSNRFFYGNLLRICTLDENQHGIFWHEVDGKSYERWYNPDEIKEIGRIVHHLLLKRQYRHDEIGVVTPFRLQAERTIEELRSNNLYSGENGAITVSTAHRFQGSERKVMIFSLVIGDKMPESTVNWIHDSRSSSKNLLNVALTRAQRQLIIVGNRSRCISAGGLLRSLAEYVARIDSKRNNEFSLDKSLIMT